MKRKMSSQNTKRLPLPRVPSGGTRVSCRPPNRYMLLKPIIKFYVLKNRIVYRKVIKKKKKQLKIHYRVLYHAPCVPSKIILTFVRQGIIEPAQYIFIYA